MKLYIDADEMYPVYFFVKHKEDEGSSPYKNIFEVPDEVVARWEEIEAAWLASQKEIAEYCK